MVLHLDHIPLSPIYARLILAVPVDTDRSLGTNSREKRKRVETGLANYESLELDTAKFAKERMYSRVTRDVLPVLPAEREEVRLDWGSFRLSGG